MIPPLKRAGGRTTGYRDPGVPPANFYMRRFARLLQKSEDPLLPPIKPEAGSEKVRHSRESGNPLRSRKSLDSRFLPAFAGMTGNDGLKTTVGACGSSSLAVNLSHMPFRPENPVFCAANTCMGRIFATGRFAFRRTFGPHLRAGRPRSQVRRHGIRSRLASKSWLSCKNCHG